jgi:phenylalanyl-tRNA synthetase beta chain
MRVPVSWLAEHVELPEELTSEQLSDTFVDLGVEVEGVEELNELTGPIVVGRVVSIETLEGFKKPIRYCVVEVGPEQTNTIVCGATNFVEGDLVVVALPGAVLPGDFAIAERKTYGKLSQGMICAVDELGIGEDHSGILVLAPGFAEPGADAIALLELTDTVLDLEITSDRGYCLSIRGQARELSAAFESSYRDPATSDLPVADGDVWTVRVEDESGCGRFLARRVTGVNPSASTPWFMKRRLMLSGIRSISLAVDVTNYVMLELGQPLHAFDAQKLTGDLVVRKAKPGEKLTTLDGSVRELDADDIVITDDTGPISLAGTMGGASTEISNSTTDILLEAAFWDPATIARMVRRHKLPSEASKRFERFVDPAVAEAALERAARLLREFGEGDIHPGRTVIGAPWQSPAVVMPMDLPDRVAGIKYGRGEVVRRLTQVGCKVEVDSNDDGSPRVVAQPPTWRNDLVQPQDLVEEVIRLEGYDKIPAILPPAPPGRGLTLRQRRRRAVARTLAVGGFVEALTFPFVAPAVFDQLALPEDDARRRSVGLLNPLEADRNQLATTLLPALFETVNRNNARGAKDLALYNISQITQAREEQIAVPEVGVGTRPTEQALASLDDSLPLQETHVAGVLVGLREANGWWGKGTAYTWADAVAAAHEVASASSVEFTVTAGNAAPWHPGRCAEFRVGDAIIGYAGEIHPKVVAALGLPKRAVAFELNLDGIPLVEKRPAPTVSAYPPVLLDVAIVVDDKVPAAEVERTLVEGAGDLLESVSLFDVYEGEQLGEGKKSLAYALRLRAADRTLTTEEATTVRDAAIAAVATLGGTLRA